MGGVSSVLCPAEVRGRECFVEYKSRPHGAPEACHLAPSRAPLPLPGGVTTDRQRARRRLRGQPHVGAFPGHCCATAAARMPAGHFTLAAAVHQPVHSAARSVLRPSFPLPARPSLQGPTVRARQKRPAHTIVRRRVVSAQPIIRRQRSRCPPPYHCQLPRRRCTGACAGLPHKSVPRIPREFRCK